MLDRNYITPSPEIEVRANGAVVTLHEKVWSYDVEDRLYEIFPPQASTDQSRNEACPVAGFKSLRASSVRCAPFSGSQSMVKDGVVFDISANDDIGDLPLDCYQFGFLLSVTYTTENREDDEEPDSTPDDNGIIPPVSESNPGIRAPDDTPILVTHTQTSGCEYVVFPDDDSMKWGIANLTTDETGEVVSREYEPGDPDGASDFKESTKGMTPAGFPLPTIEHQFVWHRVVAPPWAEIKKRLGCVNSDRIFLRTGTIEPECLLLNSYSSLPVSDASGTRCWEITYHFSEKVMNPDVTNNDVINGSDAEVTGGWNHFYNSKEGRFHRLLNKHDEPVFELFRFIGTSADPAGLFSPGYVA